jgi:hypothetical protein
VCVRTYRPCLGEAVYGRALQAGQDAFQPVVVVQVRTTLYASARPHPTPSHVLASVCMRVHSCWQSVCVCEGVCACVCVCGCH